MNNKVIVFKVFLFKLFKPLEKIFAYNRMRRDRWLTKQANKIPKGSKVLDIGAGGCPHREKFNHCKYFTQDFTQLSDLQIQNQEGYGRIDFVSDILEIPVPDKSYDAILCTEVIEHIPDPISAIQEMSRILKPGGILLITAPLQSGLHQEPYHFYGGYTKYWYKKFLLENNFEDLNIESNGSLHTTYFALGSTIFKSFLEAILNNNNLLHKLIALISLIIFAPVFLILNPIFCFFWESVYQQKGFTAGYHVSAKKVL
ncbi:MAG: SAM-dependent methyltransferase [Gammaproteobacteria bacterium]|nr:SAM-dependent methyltransferase [Gammaproteobacteria bacterium]